MKRLLLPKPSYRRRAMALIDPLIGRMSGSVGNWVFSHNAGGPYVRAKVTPTNPNSAAQQTVRSAVSSLTSRWLNILTTDQRADWATYAANVTVTNKLGNPIYIGALAHYVRSNVVRVQCGGGTGAIVDDAPSVFNLGEYTEPQITFTSYTAFTVTVDQGDAWYAEPASFMAVYVSRTQNPTINYFKGPYRKANIPVWGVGVGTLEVPTGFTAVELNPTFFRARVSRADGRLSAEWFGSAVPNLL